MLDIFAELSGLTSEVREHRLVMTRIAEALERLSPPLPAAPERAEGAPAEEPPKFYVSESPEEYQERHNQEAALAMQLGVAPWSPAFQKAVNELKADIIEGGKIVQDDRGNDIREPYSEAEAEDIVRQAFRVAASAANQRAV